MCLCVCLVLPDGPPATTATVTAAPNPTQQWAITLDGTIVKDVPVSSNPTPFLLLTRLSGAGGTGLIDWVLVLVPWIGHFHRRRSRSRALKTPSIPASRELSLHLPSPERLVILILSTNVTLHAGRIFSTF